MVYLSPTNAQSEWKALPGFLWLTGLSMVRFQPDHDMRGVASPPNVCVFFHFLSSVNDPQLLVFHAGSSSFPCSPW
jgi:hypothetical protein